MVGAGDLLPDFVNEHGLLIGEEDVEVGSVLLGWLLLAFNLGDPLLLKSQVLLMESGYREFF